MSGNDEVWVFVEYREGEITEPTLKLTSEGRRLADLLGKNLSVLAFNPAEEEPVKTLQSYGVDRTYRILVEGLPGKELSAEAYAQAVLSLTGERKPAVILFAATPTGSDVASRVAAGLNRGLIANCIDFSVDEERNLNARRAIYGGVAHATVAWTCDEPYVATVDPNVLELEEVKVSREPQVFEIRFRLEKVKTRVVGCVKADPRTVDVREADIVVGVGNGLGSSEHLKTIEELADALGAAIGGTRVALDKGWITSERQIGLSGKVISPKLYVACGISGATHHTAGVKDSKLKVVINTDKAAPIFKIADLGIVGDLREVVPAIVKKLSEVKSASLTRSS